MVLLSLESKFRSYKMSRCWWPLIFEGKSFIILIYLLIYLRGFDENRTEHFNRIYFEFGFFYF